MPNAILAHVGHGVTEGNSLFHYLSEPIHLALIGAGIVATIATAWYVRNTSKLQRERVR